ncbi:MAG TPA: hypothetical protein V6C78_31920 [Crinalium sp.]|jgi:hypothetical protein
MVSLADNTLATANNLGILLSPLEILGSFDSTDKVAYYKFTITQNSDVLVQLPGAFIDTRLIADFNGNGIDENEEYIEALTSSTNQFFIEPLPAGTYFIRMLTPSNRLTEYSLRISATPKPGNVSPDPGNTFSQALDLGVLSAQRVLQDYIGDADLLDFYKFTITQKTNLGVFVNGETQITPIFIAADENSNGVYDLGETIASRSSSENSFSVTLLPGNYFIQAGRVSPVRSTQYSLTLNPVPDFSGDDLLQGTLQRDAIRGFTGNDTILGLAGNDRLLGDAGNDRLVGGAGRDILSGGIGSDILDGETGNDVITSGGGRDRILLRRNQGLDRVTDFRNNQDKIDLTGVSFGQLTLRQQGNDVVIKLRGTNVLLIEDIQQSLLNRADFV